MRSVLREYVNFVLIKEYVTFVLIYIWFICWECINSILNRIPRGFMFLRGIKHIESDQSIIGDVPLFVQPKTLALTDGDHFLTWEGSEK